ncbi:MAG TPA: GNAT family protein [Microbacteriaceae bacterium]
MRLLRPSDAPALAAAYVRNRRYLSQWEPIRPEEYYTEAWQAAVQLIVETAREELGLHRIEASTLPHNIGSQRVLQNAGFQQIGMAPQYLQIAGKWQDHNLYQIVLHE